jgi:hypothetical protein
MIGYSTGIEITIDMSQVAKRARLGGILIIGIVTCIAGNDIGAYVRWQSGALGILTARGSCIIRDDRVGDILCMSSASISFA